jgi:PadR family transcriptional regulator, regulatory protein AphA
LSIEQLCLSILFEREATGYDIRRSFTEGEEALFADASIGAIYPALAKLEAKGLVSSVIEEQIGKPSRKIYRITPDGRDAFVAGLQEPLAKDKYQSPFLYFLRFAHLASPEVVADRIEARQRHLTKEINRLEKLLSHRSITPQGRWMLEYGLAMNEAMLDSIEAIAHKICADQGWSDCRAKDQRSRDARQRS